MSVVEQNSPVSEAEARARLDGLDGHKLVVAVSGGPDSMALLYLLAKVSSDRSRLLAVTIDHGLRPESAAEANSVAAFAAGMNIAHRTLRWSGGKPRSGVQEAARAARYRLLRDAARDFEARRIVTGHHLEDQAETVLLRLSRGSGLSGLKAMAKSVPMEKCTLLRPLLDMPKARLIATLDQANISYADDPSNRDPRFTRARLRALMPLLAAEGLEAKRLAQFARRVARADAALEAAVAIAEHEVGPADATTIDVDWTWFTGLSDEIALRLLGRLIARKGGEGSLGKLEILFAALQGEAHRVRRTLAGALVTRTPGLLSIETAPARRIKTAKNQSKAAMFECETPLFVAG